MSDSTETKIDSELFAELQKVAGALTAQEQRKHPRHPKVGRIHLHVTHQRQPLVAQLRDVSASGIGIVFREGMEIGSTFSIDLPSASGVSTIKYKVVRCRRIERGRFNIGAAIIHVTREGRTN